MDVPPFPSFTKKWHTTAYDAVDFKLPALSAAGKNVIITGGGSGIGAATALRFAQAGASSVNILGRRGDVLNSTKASIESSVLNAKVYTHIVDVTRKDSIEAAFGAIHASVGKIHVFVANAGYLPANELVKDAESIDWWKSFEINMLGSFLTTQAFLKIKAADSTLVSVASALSHVSFGPGNSSYGASKLAGIKFFAEVQLENPDVKVVSMHPGVIGTDMSKKNGAEGMDDGTIYS
jgi:NAD(P)-dependent dehydrogenase (short-subunit alcohol dehydrogenase family)